MKVSRPEPAILERLAVATARWAGTSLAVGLAFLVVIVWAITGPLFGYSDSWQLVINTGTTIVTFLMVFLIQRSQNKDSYAVHLKLNELVAALDGASHRLIDVEDLSEEELVTLHRYYQRLADRAKAQHDLRRSHSVEEVEAEGDTPKKRRRRVSR